VASPRRAKGDLTRYADDDEVHYPMATEAWLLRRVGVHHRRRGISRKAYINLATLKLVTEDETGEDAPKNI
jgi:hypothetical protein